MINFNQTQQEKEKIQINKIRNERKEITVDTIEIQGIIRAGREELRHVQGQGQWLRGATPRPR